MDIFRDDISLRSALVLIKTGSNGISQKKIYGGDLNYRGIQPAKFGRNRTVKFRRIADRRPWYTVNNLVFYNQSQHKTQSLKYYYAME